MFRKEFADILTQTGMIPVKVLKPIVDSDQRGPDIGEFKLLTLEAFDDVKLAKQLADKYRVNYLDIADAEIASDVIGAVKRIEVARYRVIPLQKQTSSLLVAIYDPSVLRLARDLKSIYGLPISFVISPISSWKKLYDKLEMSVEEILDDIREVSSADAAKDDSESDAAVEIGDDVVRLVNRVLAEAFISKVSDIHIEPYEKNFRIRYRLDGTLKVAHKPPRALMLPLISRVKLMAQMDISEKRKPQDGRIKLLVAGQAIDYRVSSMPTLFGEKIVLRLLDQGNLQLDMTKLGFEKKQLAVFKNGIHLPYGMCLVTGPTGSGKTTTLYSALAELNQTTDNISTAEDPVEFNLEGINQVNVRKEIGLTFASALKAFLRQDPDIIMVGEIRDYEAAEIAVEAALTGHMVLSTLHTNDAPSTVTRLLNMGIEPFLVTGALVVVVAQRLARKICEKCKVPDDSVSVDQLIACGIAASSAKKITVYKGKGCEACEGTGYKGRVALYEVLEMTQEVKQLVLKHASADEIKKQAIKDGMKTLRMSALTKVAQGMTTLEEAVSNSAPDKF